MKKKIDYFSFLIRILIVCVIVYPFLKDYFFENRAKELAKNNENIVEGCLFLEKKYRYRNSSDVFLYDVNIAGRIYNTSDIVIDDFPFYSQRYEFERNLDINVPCYKVKYVKVGFSFFEVRYIYDVVD